MAIGHWYSNGSKLKNAGVAGGFVWGSANNPLYATITSGYTPSATDITLNTAVGAFSGGHCANEPLSTVFTDGLLRRPVTMEPITTATKSNPDSNFVVYPVDGTTPPRWSTANTLTADMIIFYWDTNGNVSDDIPAAYYPNGTTNNVNDATTCLLLGHAPFVDDSTKLSTWSVGTTLTYEFDTTYTGADYVLFYEQIR